MYNSRIAFVTVFFIKRGTDLYITKQSDMFTRVLNNCKNLIVHVVNNSTRKCVNVDIDVFQMSELNPLCTW